MDCPDPTNGIADVRRGLVGGSPVSCYGQCDYTGIGFQGLHVISGGFTKKYGENYDQTSFQGSLSRWGQRHLQHQKTTRYPLLRAFRQNRVAKFSLTKQVHDRIGRTWSWDTNRARQANTW